MTVNSNQLISDPNDWWKTGYRLIFKLTKNKPKKRLSAFAKRTGKDVRNAYKILTRVENVDISLGTQESLSAVSSAHSRKRT